MPKVPFNDTLTPVRAEAAPQVGADFGTQKLKAQERMGNTLQQISQQAGQIATDYAVKNKNADMQADEMNYRAKKLETMNQAKLAASDSSSQDEIEKIYKDAQSKMDKWVTGKDESGNPNIRWKDQVAGIKGDAELFRVDMEGDKNARISSMNRALTTKKSNYARNVSIENHDIGGAREATAIMVENDYISADEKAMLDDEANRQISKLNVETFVFGMYNAANNDDKEEFDRNVDEMVRAGAWTEEHGANEKAQFEPKRNAADARVMLSDAYLTFTVDGNSQKYIATLEASKKEIAEMEMDSISRKSIKREWDAKYTNAIGSENKKMVRIVDNTIEKVFAGTMDHTDYLAVTKNLNPRFAKNLSDGLEEKLRDKAVTDADYANAVTIADQALDGTISWEQSWKDLSDTYGEIKILASIVIADNFREKVDAGHNIEAYDEMSLQGKKRTSITPVGNMSDIVKSIAFYAPGADSKFIEESMKDGLIWNKTGMYNGEKMTKDEFMTARFRKVSDDFVQKKAAPQVEKKQSDYDVIKARQPEWDDEKIERAIKHYRGIN